MTLSVTLRHHAFASLFNRLLLWVNKSLDSLLVGQCIESRHIWVGSYGGNTRTIVVGDKHGGVMVEKGVL